MDVMVFFRKVYKYGKFEKSLNATLISLIPKSERVRESVRVFESIVSLHHPGCKRIFHIESKRFDLSFDDFTK